MKKSTYLFKSTLLASFLLCHFAHAADTLSVVTEDWEPFNYLSKGRVVGLSTEIVEECLARANYPYKLNLVTWQRAYTEALNNANVLIYTITRTKDREDRFHWIGQIAKSNITLFKLRKRRDVVVTKKEDLKRYRITAPKDDAIYEKLVELGYPKEKIILTYGPTQDLMKLLSGEIDLMPANFWGLEERFRQGTFAGANYDDLEVAYTAEADEGLYFALSKSTPKETVEKLQMVFEQLKNEGVIRQTIVKYFKNDPDQLIP